MGTFALCVNNFSSHLQIGELAMISSKDAKEFLYKLFAERFIALQVTAHVFSVSCAQGLILVRVDFTCMIMFLLNFVCHQEIPRTSDYAPSRTFYLFSVELPQLSRMLIEKSYQVFIPQKIDNSVKQ